MGLETLIFLAKVLGQLHVQISAPSKQGSIQDFDELRKTIASYTSEEVANRVIQCLKWHMLATKVSITGLRASVIYPILDDRSPWPVLQWVEGGNVEVMAIFEIDGSSDVPFGSWVMHRGIRAGAGGGAWAHCAISWSVMNIDHLRDMFRAAQHLSGVLTWPSTDIYKLYCERSSEDCSQEEYVSFHDQTYPVAWPDNQTSYFTIF